MQSPYFGKLSCRGIVEPVCITNLVDTAGTEVSDYRGVLISGVVVYTDGMFGTAKCVLVIEMSSIQGILLREVPQ